MAALARSSRSSRSIRSRGSTTGGPRRAARGIDVIDFGVGDPREATPAFIREALVGGDRRGVVLPARGRAARAAARRSPAGSRGASASRSIRRPRSCRRSARRRRSSRSRRSRSASGRVVAIPEPAYPVYERGALFAGADVRRPCRCARSTAGCPDLDAFDALGRDRRCSGRATRTTRPARPRRSRSTRSSPARAREHGFLLCSDEAYSELWFDEPPASALQVADRENVVVFNTLSKRSSMTGLPLAASSARRRRSPTRCGRSGRRSARRRRSSSSAPSVAALGDEGHVEDVRARLPPQARHAPAGARARRACGSPAATRRSSSGSPSTAPSEAFARRLLEHGILVAPGSFFGPAGEGYVRFALVPTQAECERARARFLAEACL